MDIEFLALLVLGYLFFGLLFAVGVERAAWARVCKKCGMISSWRAKFNFFWFKNLFRKTLTSDIYCRSCGEKEAITILKKENRIIS